MFRVGDRVRVTNPHPKNEQYRGFVGTVAHEETGDYDASVLGLDGTRVWDRVRHDWLGGIPGFTNDELSRA